MMLEKRLVLLELSQKAADIYPKKTATQKRLIITKLFKKLTYEGDSVSVIYTSFAHAVAEKSQETSNLMGAL